MLTGPGEDEFDAALMQRLRAEDEFAESEDGELMEGDDAAEMAALVTALRSYRAESLDWAETRSAAMPSPLPPNARVRRAAWLQAPQWSLGLLGLCACVLGGAVYTHHQATLMERATITLPSAPTEQALAEDNQLLSLVDTAVQSTGEPSEQELGLTSQSMGERVQTHRYAQQHAN